MKTLTVRRNNAFRNARTFLCTYKLVFWFFSSLNQVQRSVLLILKLSLTGFRFATAASPAAVPCGYPVEGYSADEQCLVIHTSHFRLPPLSEAGSATSSVAVLAEILLRSPRKLFISIIKKIYFWNQESKKYIVLF